MDPETGYVSCAFAVVLFGVFPITTKTSITADGMFYQLLMCMGIFTVGAVVYFVQCSTGHNAGISSSTATCPQFEPMASLGGAIWCLSNLLLCPLVNAWGVGLTMMTWGMAEMFAGWGTGRFGLFGLHKEAIAHPGENSAAVALALLSLLILGLAQPAVADGTDKAPVEASSSSSSSSSSVHASLLPAAEAEGEEGDVHAIQVGKTTEQGETAQLCGEEDRKADFIANGYDPVRAMSPLGKRVFGFCGSICAGLLSGSTFTPVQRVIDADAAGSSLYPGASTALLDFLFSHFTGIIFSSILYFILYACITQQVGGRHGPWMSSALVVPAYVSGLIWGVAMVCWFLANANLEIVIAFPMVTVGPGIVNLLIGAVFFREVHGRRNIALLLASACLYTGAAVLISLSGGAS